MAKIYGTPIMAGGAGGANKDLPPLLDNFKAFEGGVVDDGLTRLKDLPNGTKVKFGTYNSQTLVWRIAQDEGVTKAVLDLDYDTGKTVIGDMVVSPNKSICGNWAITGWLNATEAGGSWWDNRVHYEDSEYPETEPTYSSQDGFLHGWSEADRGLLQNIDWDCDDLRTQGNEQTYQLKCKLMICSDDEATAAWNGDRFTKSNPEGNAFVKNYDSSSAAYGGISIMGTSITSYDGPNIDALNTAWTIWPVCAPNPEAIVSDEPDDDGCYTISNKRSTVKDLQIGEKIKVAVNPDFQSEFGSYMVFEKVDQDHEGYPENSSTLMTEQIVMARAMEGTSYTTVYFENSALQQYLNSNKGAGEWFQVIKDGQVAPTGTGDSNITPAFAYANKPGFLNVLDSGFVKNILETSIGSVNCKFYIPLAKEVNCTHSRFEAAEASYTSFKAFTNNASRIKTLSASIVASQPSYDGEVYGGGVGAPTWETDAPAAYTLRSHANESMTTFIEADGNLSLDSSRSVAANKSCGIVLVCNISNSLPLVSDTPDEEGCYLVDWNKINVTIQADKMLESRANELAGAVWVYGDHEPESVNDGTKIQLSREEIITDKEPGPETITLADIPVSDAETETIVKLKESDGILHPYIYLVNGYEGSNGALLLRKDLAGQSAWSSSTSTVNYIGQSLDSFIQSNFVNQLDILVKSALINVSIKTNLTNSTVKAFALSVTELNITSGTGNVPTEGSAIPYFNSPQRRIADGYYWTRTHVSGNQNAIHVNTSGNPEQGTTTNPSGVRPAIVLPLTFKLKATANSDGSYDMYKESSSTISTSDIDENYQVTRTIQWDSTKDFFARQFTYNSKKQYQTMLEGAIATLNDVPEGQPITELESGSKVKLGVWNDTPLQWRVARDTSDQSVRLVLEPTSVSLLGTMAYDAKEPSNSDSNRKTNGNNRYIYSNIHQWLNATKASEWYTAQHSADAAPAYASSPGFLSGWSETDLSALDEATLTTTKASVDGGGTETFVARAALISTTELGLQSDTGGGRLDIFNTNGDRITGESYWTRTPHPSDSYRGCQVSATGSLYNIYSDVFYAVEVRPLCSPKSTTYVSLQPDSDGCYTITGVNE